MRSFVFPTLLTIFTLCSQSALAATVEVPGMSAYSDPDPNSLRRSREGAITRWEDARQKVLWFGEVKRTGELITSIRLALPKGDTADFSLTIHPVADHATATKLTGSATGGDAEVLVKFGTMTIAKVGYYQFTLEGTSKSGKSFGDVAALLLEGPAAAEAHFSKVERRNAASVHLSYPVEKGTEVQWFYNEITAKTDPVHSFYMACGFHRGYFGMQVNSAVERRIIFSVWDSGNEAVDRSKVAEEDQVKLLAKGEGVVAHGFGNEGTGGHSHLVYPWKTGEPQRFLLGAKPNGKSTTYTAWFYFPDRKAWGLIATFRAPKDGSWLKGLHSFNENFVGSNGHLQRHAEFGPQWIRSADGTWQELLTASFTHDGHGKDERKDYSAAALEQTFSLSNGGWIANGVKYGDKFTRKASGSEPPAYALSGLQAAAKAFDVP